MRLRAEGTVANKRAALPKLDTLRNLVMYVQKSFSWAPAMILLTISQLYPLTLQFYACTLSLL